MTRADYTPGGIGGAVGTTQPTTPAPPFRAPTGVATVRRRPRPRARAQDLTKVLGIGTFDCARHPSLRLDTALGVT